MRDYDPLGFTEEEHEEMLEMMRKAYEKAQKEDPFYSKAKKKGKKKPKRKAFSGYNWTTIKKMNRGQRDKIRLLTAKGKPRGEEAIQLKRLTQLYRWSKWALKMHKEGWSDKRIHAEAQKRKAAKARA